MTDWVDGRQTVDYEGWLDWSRGKRDRLLPSFLLQFALLCSSYEPNGMESMKLMGGGVH